MLLRCFNLQYHRSTRIIDIKKHIDPNENLRIKWYFLKTICNKTSKHTFVFTMFTNKSYKTVESPNSGMLSEAKCKTCVYRWQNYTMLISQLRDGLIPSVHPESKCMRPLEFQDLGEGLRSDGAIFWEASLGDILTLGMQEHIRSIGPFRSPTHHFCRSAK